VLRRRRVIEAGLWPKLDHESTSATSATDAPKPPEPAPPKT
jgi:hypothetical protein